MPVFEKCYDLVARRAGEAPSDMGEDHISISIKFVKATARRRSRSDQMVYESAEEIAGKQTWVGFSTSTGIKQKRNESYYKEALAKLILSIGVPEFYHHHIFKTLFDQIEAAVSPDPPIVILVLEIYLRIEDEVPISTRAATSAIEALETVRLDRAIVEQTESCAICWKDFEQEDVDQLILTRMPCSHYFHGDCILKWLRINHLCPMCRYPLPIEEEP